MAIDAEPWRCAGSRAGATPTAFPLLAAAVLLVVLGALALAIIPSLGSLFAYQKSYTEGWAAYHAARAASGEVLYTGDPYRLVNYPFLWFYLVGWLGPLFGGVVATGRVLSFLALGLVVGGSAVVVRRLGGRPLDAVFAGACVLGYQAIQAVEWIGAGDPQMLGEAWMIAGLACYLRDRRSAARLAATAALLAIGGFTKHNLIAIPAAITCDILWHDRRRFGLWCGFAGAALAVLTGLTYLVAGGDFLHELFAPRVLDLHQMRYHPQKFAIVFKIPMLLGLVFLARKVPPGQGVLLRAYGLVSLVSAVLFSAGDGISYNIFLDPVIFLAIVAGLAFAEWRERLPESRWVRRAALVLLPLVLAQPIITRLPRTVERLIDLPAVLRSFSEYNSGFKTARDLIRGIDGPAVCDNILMCFEAGKPLIVDAFNTRQMILTGRLDEAALIEQIRQHRFAVIELPDVIYLDDRREKVALLIRSPFRFTPQVLRAIDDNYAPSLGSSVALYMPKSDPSGPPDP